MSASRSDAILERLMSLHPKVIDLVLDRVERLLAALGNPEQGLPPVVHIAGTNGKGSTLAMIRAGLEGGGERCSAYTSPHLARFHERIRLPDGLIAEGQLTALLEECEQANGGAPITYFEITTCAAFLAFSRAPADWTLLETGLGGRLDATNVVDQPALTVITPISLDHQKFLGDSIAEIAGEKAGILKPGVPCIVSRQDDAAMDAIETRAGTIGAPLTIMGRDFDAWEEAGRLVFQDENGLLDLPAPVLLGAHQIANAGVAIAALRRLGAGVPEAAMTDPQWPARMQRLRDGPLVEAAPADVWLDGGHNPAAGAAIAESLSRMPERPLHIICGMLDTKDVEGFLRPLAPHVAYLHAVSIPGERATLEPAATAAHARACGIQAGTAASPIAALATVPEGVRVLICGSLYLAGSVLRENA